MGGVSFPLFDEKEYLAINPDVKAKGVQGLLHYELYGRRERRKIPKSSPRLGKRSIRQSLFGGQKSDLEIVLSSNFFDSEWYSNKYGINGDRRSLAKHYVTEGWLNGNDPSSRFSTGKYLAFYEDVQKEKKNPLCHYLKNKKDRLAASSQTQPLDFLLITSCRKKDGVYLWRIQHLAEILKQKGYVVRCESLLEPSKSLLENLWSAKVVVFSRPNSSQISKRIIRVLSKRNIPYYFDIDDLLDVDHIAEMGRYRSDPGLFPNIYKSINSQQQMYSLAEAFIVSTSELRDHFKKKYNVPVYVVQNAIPKNVLEKNGSCLLDYCSHSTFNLLYPSGSPTHDYDASTACLDILNFLITHKDAQLTILGSSNLGTLLADFCPNQVIQIPFVPFQEMLKFYQNADLVLVPLAKNKFNNAKSNIKFIEAASVCTPVLATDVSEFQKVIEDGVNGYLAKENFLEKLEQAYKDRNELKNKGLAAHESLRNGYISDSVNVDFLEKALC